MKGKIIALSKSPAHGFSKENCSEFRLLKGLGIEGDAHCGEKVKHRSRVAKDPTQPNLRQIHLIHSELFEELKASGFDILPGQIGENITTQNLDLLALPKGTKLFLGDSAIVEITGLRNPCNQLNLFKKGLQKAVLDKDEDGNLIRKSGIMGIVLEGGVVKVGEEISVELPPKPHEKLERV